MSNIVFIGAGDRGSYQMRGIQTVQAIEKYHGLKTLYTSSSYFLDNIDTIKNHIFIFVGEPIFHCQSVDNLIKLSKNNILIYDVVDNFCFNHTNIFDNKSLIDSYKHLTALIHPNSYSKIKAKEILPWMNHVVIPHQWDIRNENIPTPELDYIDKAAYIGDLRGFWLDQDILKDYVDVFNDPFSFNGKHALYNVHISFRPDNSKDYLYKPCTKLAISSCFRSILLCNNEEAIKDIVGDAYQFYIKSHYDVINKMDWIRGMGYEDLNYFRETTLAIRNYLSPMQTSNRYINLLKEYI